MIPEHQRVNFERTDHLLHEANALLQAVFEFADAPDGSSRHVIAYTLRCMAMERVQAAQRAHSMEWVGLGGNSHDLTEAETAEAAGKAIK